LKDVAVDSASVRTSKLVLLVDKGFDVGLLCPNIVRRLCARLCQLCTSQTSHDDSDQVFWIRLSDLRAVGLPMVVVEPSLNLLAGRKRYQ